MVRGHVEVPKTGGVQVLGSAMYMGEKCHARCWRLVLVLLTRPISTPINTFLLLSLCSECMLRYLDGFELPLRFTENGFSSFRNLGNRKFPWKIYSASFVYLIERMIMIIFLCLRSHERMIMYGNFYCYFS